MKQILVTTKHRGVFAGEVSDDFDMFQRAFPLSNAKMAIYFGTTRGLMELCETGPTNSSKISAPANIPMLHDVTAIFDITPEAWAKWQVS
jgi:hypothetical protein